MREALAELEGGGAVIGADVLEHVRVIRGIDDDGDGAVVLGGAAEHGGAADVDVLDGLLEGDVGFGDGLLEGVEVDDHEVDGLDAVFLGLFLVGLVAAQVEEAAVDLGVQGLDAAIEDLRRAGEGGDFGGGDVLLLEEGGGAAGGDDLDSHGRQFPGELDQAGLV